MHSKIISLIALFSIIFVSTQSSYCDDPSQTSPSKAATPCSACHEKQVKSMTDPEMHASVHAKIGLSECTDCHDEAALKESHADVKPGETRFVKARRYPKKFCLRCHGTLETLAKNTEDSKFLTDVNGKVVNPHDLPKNPKHFKMDECSTCHKEHKKNPDIKTYCMTCHHTGEFISCAKCHS